MLGSDIMTTHHSPLIPAGASALPNADPSAKAAATASSSPALRHAATGVKATAAALAALFVAFPAHSQSMEERLRTQLRNTTQQLQQVQSQQAQLAAARAAAEAQRDAAAKELEQLRAQLSKAQGQAEKLASQQDAIMSSAQSQVNATQSQLGKYKSAYDELLGMARKSEAERTTLRASLTQTDAQLKSCVQHNDDLYASGKELLAAYESFSTADLMAIRQPFAGRARVAFDERAQSYGDKLYEGKFDARTGQQAAPGEDPASAAAAPPAAAPAISAPGAKAPRVPVEP